MGEIMTPKQIAKKIKSRGYGKQHLYCQMCKKQCRDENSFKQHRTTAKHISRMALFVENEDQFVSRFSDEFENGMMNIIKTVYRKIAQGSILIVSIKNQLSPITTVHHHYIRARSHTRLNGTRWETLDDFAKYLGREGKAEVEQTAHGFSVLYRDKDPDLVAKQEKKLREKKIEHEDQLIQSWIDNHNVNNNSSKDIVSLPTELDLSATKNIKFEFKAPLKKAPTLINDTNIQQVDSPVTINTSTTTITTTATPSISTTTPSIYSINDSENTEFINTFGSSQQTAPKKQGTTVIPTKDVVNKRKGEVLEIDENELKKKRTQRKGIWICKGIVVKITNKQLSNGKYYKQKGVIEDIKEGAATPIALIKMLDMPDKLKMDQSQLETVIPNIGGSVMVVNGKYQGCTGVLTALNEQKFCVQVKLSGEFNGVLTWEEYEDVSRLASK